MSLRVIHIEGADRKELLNELKQYASVPDNSRDALLRSLLRAAILKVQEYADRAFLPTKLEQTAEVDGFGSTVRLYEGGGEVLSFVDADGYEVDYAKVDENLLRIREPFTGTVKVTYITRPDIGDEEQLKVTVLRYATALYDGEDTETLNAILREVL